MVEVEVYLERTWVICSCGSRLLLLADLLLTPDVPLEIHCPKCGSTFLVTMNIEEASEHL